MQMLNGELETKIEWLEKYNGKLLKDIDVAGK